MKDYHINIFYSAEGGGYIADIPDLEACSAFGKTPAEALKQVEIARKVWLEAARAEGKPVPEPKYRPVTYQTPIYVSAARMKQSSKSAAYQEQYQSKKKW